MIILKHLNLDDAMVMLGSQDLSLLEQFGK